MRPVRQIGRRLSWGVADQAVSSLTNFAVNIYIARYLGAVQYGAFSLAFVTYGFALQASRGLATDPLLVRFSATDVPTWRRAVANCTGTATAVGMATGACVLAAAALLSGVTRQAFLALGLTLPGLLLQDSWRFAFFALGRGSLAFLNDPQRRAAIGPGAERQHLRYIELFNAALAGRPAGLTVCTHLCRGNFRSGWLAEGSYEHVAEALFNELQVDGFFLEYDDARSGGFAPLRFVPKGKMVVLGLVTTKTPALESKDMLKRRIDEAAKYVPLEQLCLSPQCGFASTAEGNVITLDDEIAKLRLVVETAREVWG